MKGLAAWLMLATTSGCAGAKPPAEDVFEHEQRFCAGNPNQLHQPRRPSSAEVEAARVSCAAGDSAKCQFYFEHHRSGPPRPCEEIADGIAAEFLIYACEKRESSACAAAALICDSPAYRQALDELRRKLETRCMERDAQACALGSMIYDSGIGVEPDRERFMSLASSACEAGNGNRCSYLALLAARGKLPGVDPSRARAWNEHAARSWTRGCDAGHADACLELGSEMLVRWTYGPEFAPSGIPQDLPRGLLLLEKACPGEPVACVSLAMFRESGSFVPRDLAGAAAMYRRACEGGLRSACNDLGRMLAAGLGVVKDCQVARSLFRQTCDAGSRVGCQALREGVGKATSSLEID